ncbi:MAG: alpha-amylase family glycosyl hydrolase, partial [Bacteroidales bacterium]
MIKKLLFVLALLPGLLPAQIVTTNPVFPTSSGAIEVIFDANQGNKGMIGATECYAHTGVITNKSTSSSDWKYAPTWLDNSPKYKLTSLGNNKWKLLITPDIRGYYGILDPTESVKQMALVFRNEKGTKEGKDTGGKDIFVNIYQTGVNVEIKSPQHRSVVTPTTTVPVTVEASVAGSLSIFLNSTESAPIATANNQTSLSVSRQFPAGDYKIIAQLTTNGATLRDTSYICSASPAVSQQRPGGLQDGITYNNDGSVTFSLYAPKKKNVFLLGDFNDFLPSNNYQMKYESIGTPANQENHFWITIPGLDPNKEYAFQYLVDGTIRVGDPYCEKILDPWNDKWINEKYTIYPNLREYPATKTEDILSVFQINKPAFQWSASDFKVPTQDNLMIYELLFRDFTVEGSVQAAIDKLDYLASLGINAIELMPVQEFDGNDSWGYNPNFYFAPDKAYGTANDYKEFIDECHKRGIAVILDVVFNHSWGLSPMCKMWWDATNNRPAADNPYYNPVATHPYSVGSDFNHSEPKVRDFFKKVLQHWMTEYKIDGFRFDLSKGFTQTNSGTNVSYWSQYDASRIGYIKEYVDAIKETNPDAYAIMEHFADATEENEIASYQNTLLWNNDNYNFGEAMMGWSGNSDLSSIKIPKRISYMESHDEERLTYKAQAFGDVAIMNSLEKRLKQHATTAAFAYLSPGPRMMWQFGEMGYDYNIDYNGRTGRKPVRWDYLDDPNRKTLHESYTKILNLRKKYPQVFNSETSFNWQVASSNWGNGKRLEYNHKDMDVIVVGNFMSTNINTIPDFTKTGTWYELVSESTLTVTDIAMTVPLGANEFKVFTSALPTSLGPDAQ